MGGGENRRERKRLKTRSSVCPVTSCNQNTFPLKHVAEKEELSHSIEYVYSAERHPPTVKQAPQLQ